MHGLPDAVWKNADVNRLYAFFLVAIAQIWNECGGEAIRLRKMLDRRDGTIEELRGRTKRLGGTDAERKKSATSGGRRNDRSCNERDPDKNGRKNKRRDGKSHNGGTDKGGYG